jgi:hypothetical protein
LAIIAAHRSGWTALVGLSVHEWLVVCGLVSTKSTVQPVAADVIVAITNELVHDR